VTVKAFVSLRTQHRRQVAAAAVAAESPPQPPAPPPVDVPAVQAAAREEGRAQAAAELQGRLMELEARVAAAKVVADELVSLRRQAGQRAAEDIAAMVIELTRKIAGDTLALHPEALPGIITRALEQLPDDEVVVRVPKGSGERVRAMVSGSGVTVVEDAKVGQGCVVEGKAATIERTLAIAMEGVAEATRLWLASR